MDKETTRPIYFLFNRQQISSTHIDLQMSSPQSEKYPRTEKTDETVESVHTAGSDQTAFSSSPTRLQHLVASLRSTFSSYFHFCSPDLATWRCMSGFLAYFIFGWGDGVTGTLLPFMMKDLHLNFLSSSSLFLASTTGFIIGTLLLESILKQLGLVDLNATPSRYPWVPAISLTRRITHSNSQSTLLAFFIGSTLHGISFAMMGSGGGFGVVFSAYAVAAFARSILTGPMNKFFGDATASYAFGFWTLGGMVSTLLCQSLLALNVPWTKFFLGSLVLSVTNILFLVITFRPTSGDLEEEIREAENEVNNPKALCTALSSGRLWAIIIFTVLYYGCETPTQGFIVSYLLDIRNANPKTVGYASSGFWAGITIGQFVWGVVEQKLKPNSTQRKIAVLICLSVGLVMQILIWTIPSFIGNSISASIIGLVYGPVFPATFALARGILSKNILRISLALISAASNIGSALFSFVLGIISNAEGIRTLPYLTVSLAITSTCIWAFIPAEERTHRDDHGDPLP